ncbi:MAG: Flp pilus assembly protein CpaB [Deltaproteobacteria bacterium]|nr:Flp pilus assembly protein CpaB [Deltaproteobacteria bacterium]
MPLRISLLVALVSGVIGAYLVQAHLVRLQRDLRAGTDLVEMVVVGEDLPAGAVLQAGSLARQRLPQKYRPGSALTPEDVDLVLGQPLTVPLKRGDPLLWAVVGGAQPPRGLADRIREGGRALAIPVDPVAAVGGHLRPGNRVDILVSNLPTGQGREGVRTVLENVLILATGSERGQATEQGQEPGGEQPSDFSTVTLLVEPQEAPLLVHARDLGKLTLTLRHPEDLARLPGPGTRSGEAPPRRPRQVPAGAARAEVIKAGELSPPAPRGVMAPSTDGEHAVDPGA